MQTTIRTSCLLLLLMAPITLRAGEDDSSPADRWVSFRGSPRMTGVSKAKLPEKLERLWSYETKDMIEATAAIADDMVYVPVMNGKCVALKLSDGSHVWTFTDPSGDGVKSSPCLTDQIVCYGNAVGVIRALDRKTGKEVWNHKTDAEIISSPIVIDGKIFVGGYDGALHCLDAKTGTEVWQVQTEQPVHCSPTLINGNAAVAGCDGVLRLISVKTGKEVKQLEIGGNIASTPAADGDKLFLGTMGNHVYGVDTTKMSQLWMYENPRRKFPYFGSAAVANGLAIIGGRDKTLHAIEQASGKAKWTFVTQGRVDGSPVVVGDRVFVGSLDGVLYELNIADGSKKWEYVTGSAISASPAVASGKLVIGDQNGAIHCFGQK